MPIRLKKFNTEVQKFYDHRLHESSVAGAVPRSEAVNLAWEDTTRYAQRSLPLLEGGNNHEIIESRK